MKPPAERRVITEELLRFGMALPRVGPYRLDGYRDGHILSAERIPTRDIHRSMWEMEPGDFVVRFLWEPNE